jgi:hypothetical protein
MVTGLRRIPTGVVIGAVIVAVIVFARGTASAGCNESDPVLGYRYCGGFGRHWAHSGWAGLTVIDDAMVVARVAVRDTNASGTAYSPFTSTMYRSQLVPGTNVHPLGIGGRARAGYQGTWFTSMLELTIVGFGKTQVMTTTVDGPFAGATGAVTRSEGGYQGDVAAVVGVHNESSRFNVGFEIAAGGRDVHLESGLPNSFTTCAGGATGRNCSPSFDDTRLLFEPRIRAAWWASRELTVTATLGRDVVAGGETFGIGLALHLSPYDGL